MPAGKFPFRRTYEFLSAGQLILKADVKSLLLKYTGKKESLGLRNFIYKDIPQIQFKNKCVQIVTAWKRSEIPSVNVFFGNGKKVMIDVEDKTAPEIMETFSKVVGATEREVEASRKTKYPGRFNPANFGKYAPRYCICQVPGQAPCPSLVTYPLANKPKPWQERDEETVSAHAPKPTIIGTTLYDNKFEDAEYRRTFEPGRRYEPVRPKAKRKKTPRR